MRKCSVVPKHFGRPRGKYGRIRSSDCNNRSRKEVHCRGVIRLPPMGFSCHVSCRRVSRVACLGTQGSNEWSRTCLRIGELELDLRFSLKGTKLLGDVVAMSWRRLYQGIQKIYFVFSPQNHQPKTGWRSGRVVKALCLGNQITRNRSGKPREFESRLRQLSFVIFAPDT